MQRLIPLAVVLAMAACSSGPKLPPPNTAQATFDRSAGAVQVIVSSIAPPTGAALVSASGARYAASGFSVLSSPHVAYNPPPSIGLGVGGFGFGSGGGFGSGVGVGFPVGGPTVAEVSNQYIVSTEISLPPDYRANWPGYHIEILSNGPPMVLPAPAPG